MLIVNRLIAKKGGGGGRVRVMVFNATLNNISVYRGGQFYRWRKRVHGENQQPATSH